MLVVLNKIDMIEENKREETIQKRIKALDKNLSKTCKDIIYLPISCKENIGIKDLLKNLQLNTIIPERNVNEKFLFLVDHSFFIKG